MSTKSVVVQKFGGYDVLHVKDFPLPEVQGDSYVDVDVKYGGLNFFDLYSRQGVLKDSMSCPFVLGIECSGTVAAVTGHQHPNLKVGQRVICYNYNGGMFRERIRVRSECCFPIPDDVTFDMAATVFVNYLTAYFAVFRQGNLRKNETVLILSCAGGVGWAATQLAKTIEGVTVLGTGAPHKEQLALQNGVDTFIPTNDLENYLKVNNIAVDLIVSNQSSISRLSLHLRPLGRAVILGASEMIRHQHELGWFDKIRMFPSSFLSLFNLTMRNHCVAGLHLGLLLDKEPDVVRGALDDVWQLWREGKVKPRIHAEFKMADIVPATKELAQRKNIGKVVLKIGGNDEEQT